jgi:hypothetical protein
MRLPNLMERSLRWDTQRFTVPRLTENIFWMSE